MRLRHTAALALALLVAVPATAMGAPNFGGASNLSGAPGYLDKGSDDNVWVTISGGTGDIGRVKPSGNVTEFDPLDINNAKGITKGPAGNMWVTQDNGVARFPVDDPDSATDFSINEITDPRAIVFGPQKKLWAASGDQLVSFKPNDPAGYDAQQINGMGARGITASGGKIWIADFTGGRIIKVTPKSGDDDVKRYAVEGAPQEVAAGPNGGISFTDPDTDPQTVGLVPANGHPDTTNDPDSDPFGMHFMNDGKTWFAEFARDSLGILSQNGSLKHFNDLPDNSGPRYVTEGKNGVLYVGLETSQKVAQIKGIN